MKILLEQKDCFMLENRSFEIEIKEELHLFLMTRPWEFVFAELLRSRLWRRGVSWSESPGCWKNRSYEH